MQSPGEGEEDPVIGPAAPPNLARGEQILPILARGERQLFALGQISGEVFVPHQICVRGWSMSIW
jgi:hypothetical protein